MESKLYTLNEIKCITFRYIISVVRMVGVKSEGTKYKTWENWIILSLDAKLLCLHFTLIRLDECCKL